MATNNVIEDRTGVLMNVLLNLLNKLKKDKMQRLPSFLSLFLQQVQ